MSRPHEDRERHTLVDHRPGGAPVSFEAGAWFAIEIARVKPDRIDAALSAYETMVEQSRASDPEPRNAVVFAAANQRQVVVICAVDGHEGYRRLASAWDDHHRFAAGRAVTESRSLGIYRVAHVSGDMTIDPASSDAYIVERSATDRDARIAERHDPSGAAGFRGSVAFRSDDHVRSIAIYRFERIDQFEAMRGGSEPHAGHMHPVKTFAAPHEAA